MVFDVYDRAFIRFNGACGRGIYDSMKTPVEPIGATPPTRYACCALQPRPIHAIFVLADQLGILMSHSNALTTIRHSFA